MTTSRLALIRMVSIDPGSMCWCLRWVVRGVATRDNSGDRRKKKRKRQREEGIGSAVSSSEVRELYQTEYVPGARGTY